MAGQQSRQDPKKAALAAARCLNPHPEQVTDPEFLGSDFLDARDAALESWGLEGLVPARPGPRGASKLTEEVLAWAEEQLAADPALRPAQLPDRIEAAFGVRVHPRSVERALARRRERHSKSR